MKNRPIVFSLTAKRAFSQSASTPVNSEKASIPTP